MENNQTYPTVAKRSFLLKFRIPLIILSLLFMTGGAFNDGWTEWFWALPFFVLLYKILPVRKILKILICLLIFISMIVVADKKWKSSVVFPVVGQQVILLDNLDVYSFKGSSMLHYNYQESDSSSDIDIKHIPKNTTLFVKQVYMSYADFGSFPKFVLSNGTQDLELHYRSLMDISPITKKENDRSICKKVRWDFCRKANSQPFSIPDPMARPFRWLSHLMFYPVSPLLLFNQILSLVFNFIEPPSAQITIPK